MRLHEEFVVAEPVGTVWKFLEQPESVAGCLPGVEYVRVLDDENVHVRATQSVGPMTATFDAKVTVLERVPEQLIRFRAAGRSVRGSVGNVRTETTVRLRGAPEGTSVAVDGDMVLAGAIGSVGQKVIARQASKVTAEFAANLRRAELTWRADHYELCLTLDMGATLPPPLSVGEVAGVDLGEVHHAAVTTTRR